MSSRVGRPDVSSFVSALNRCRLCRVVIECTSRVEDHIHNAQESIVNTHHTKDSHDRSHTTTVHSRHAHSTVRTRLRHTRPQSGQAPSAAVTMRRHAQTRHTLARAHIQCDGTHTRHTTHTSHLTHNQAHVRVTSQSSKHKRALVAFIHISPPLDRAGPDAHTHSFSIHHCLFNAQLKHGRQQEQRGLP